MKFLSLFSGVGGFDLGLERAGMECVGQVENNEKCLAWLYYQWPNVKKIKDIHDVKGNEFGPVQLICGGFPCQPHSNAGKKLRTKDDRFLWPEMLRVIQELKPRWVLGENVTGFIRMGLDEALSDLEGCGYETQAFIIPACGVDAPHLRERVFIVAHRNGERFDGSGAILRGDEGGQTDHGITNGENGHISAAYLGQDVADAGLLGQTKRKEQAAGVEQYGEGGGTHGAIKPRMGLCPHGISPWLVGHRERWADGSWEDGIPRVATGVKDRVNRLKALGNAVVPQQVYPILGAIAEIERLLTR